MRRSPPSALCNEFSPPLKSILLPLSSGRSWGPSKARDVRRPVSVPVALLLIFRHRSQEFLFYYEKENGIKSQMVERMKSSPRTYAIGSPPPCSLHPLISFRASTRTQLVKQTYSVNVHSPNSPNIRKWHLSEGNARASERLLISHCIRRLLLCRRGGGARNGRRHPTSEKPPSSS